MKTYNFIEACNSGKKFGFKDRPAWHVKCGYEEFADMEDWLDYLITHYGYASIEIINGVFILEEKKIEITESQLDEFGKALRAEYLKCKSCDHFFAVGNCYGCNNEKYKTTIKAQKLKKELGF